MTILDFFHDEQEQHGAHLISEKATLIAKKRGIASPQIHWRQTSRSFDNQMYGLEISSGSKSIKGEFSAEEVGDYPGGGNQHRTTEKLGNLIRELTT